MEMEKGKRIEAEFHLPEAITQHIQSFLSGKEAAQTTLLSKSWYNAWLTRPNLDFDQKDFAGESGYDSEIRFWKFVKKIVKRYVKLNLKIHSLRLWINGPYDAKHHSYYSLIDELITQALKMGATDLDFKIMCDMSSFTLPHEVFGSENLIRLSVSGCTIRLGPDRKISCSRLNSLTLDQVDKEGDIIWDIISSCPLIENLSLSLSEISDSFLEFGKQNVGSVLNKFHKLKRLVLFRVRVDPLYFDDFSSIFPCLKELTLHHCTGFNIIKISSPSLECINFTQKMLRVKFDVPHIRKFAFSGSCIPSLSFKSTTSNWESDISITRQSAPSRRWFLELNKLLKKLCLSKISLSLKILTENTSECCGRIQCLSKPEVENLTIDGPYSVCPALFYGLFQCCRPIYIMQYWNPKSYHSWGKEASDFTEFVFKRLMQQVSLNSCIAYQRMSGGCNLEEVSVEFYDESVSGWRPSTSVGTDEQRTRVHLKWRR